MFIISTIFVSSFICVDIHIEDVLPDTTIAVIQVENAKDLSNNLEAIGICDSVCEFGQFFADTDDEFDLSTLADKYQSLLDVMGLDRDSLPIIPSCKIQGGIYPVVDYEAGSVNIAILAIAELGDSKWLGIFEDSLEDVAAGVGFGIEQIDLSGHLVWMLSVPVAAASSEADFQRQLSNVDRLYIATNDGYLIVGSDPDGVATALGVIDGDREENTLASSDLYQELMRRRGDKNDIYAAVLLTNLADTIIQIDDSGMAMMILPMVKSFVGDVDGISQSINISASNDAVFESDYTVYMGDGRNGLLGLISNNSTESSIPSYVTEETLSYSQLQIDMDKVVPFLMETISSNPILAMQLGPQSEEVEKMLQMAFAPLGTQVHIVTSGYMPIESDSLGYLVAIECKDEKAFSDFLASTMPSMGADPTDFLGYQIYTADFEGGMMMPIDLSFSFSVGGGYVFIGTTRPVEQALRAIANPRDFKGNQGQNDSLHLVSIAGSTGWGYADPAKSMEIQTQLMDGISEDMFADMEEFDPDMAAEMRKEFEDSQKRQMEMMNIFSSLLGPTSWTMTTDENGFNAHGVMIRPAVN